MAKTKFCHTRIYSIWRGMKQRCYNPSCKEYKIYGGRGINICEEWTNKENGSKNFYNWARSNGYRFNLSIDRIDPDGNYCPENCRWATSKQQGNNKRNTIKIEFDGKIKPISYWCKKYKLHRLVVYRRYKNGIRGFKLFVPAGIKGIKTKSLSAYSTK